MTARRRAGTWQGELSRSFSRFFSRSSSQDSDRAEEQEPGEEPSPSRQSPESATGRGDREEPERTRGISQEERGRGGAEDHSRREDNNSNLTLDSNEKLPSIQPEQVKQDQSSSPALQNISESEEEKDGEFTHNSKVLDSEKQSRENFFHFIGNLFHISPKPTLGNSKQASGVQDLCKEHEYTQVKNNLDKEDLNQEQTLDVCSGAEQATEQSTAHEEENPSVSNSETAKEVRRQEENEKTPSETPKCEETPTGTPKLNGYALNAPAITYGTYRGSRRIRKLLKRRADVNSPIQEKEETSEKENNSTEDAGTENSLMLHQLVKMEQASYRNYEDQIPPSKIQLKRQSKTEDLDQNVKIHLHALEDVKSKTEKSSNILDDLQPNDMESSKNDLEPDSEEISKTSEDLQQKADESLRISGAIQPNAEETSTISEALRLNAEECSNISEDLQPSAEETSNKLEDLQPNLKESSESLKDLEPNAEKSSQISEDLQPNAEESSNILYDLLNAEERSTISENLQPNAEKSSKISDTSQHTTKESSNILDVRQPGGKESSINSEDLDATAEKSLHISDDLQPNAEKSSTISEDLQPNAEESAKILEDLQSNAEESLRITGDIQPDAKGGSKTSEDLQLNSEESSKTLEDSQLNAKESTNITKNLQPKMEENSADMQPKTIEISYNLKSTQPNSEQGSNMPKDLLSNSKEGSNIPEDLQPSVENNSKAVVNLKMSHDPKEHVEHCNTEDLQANTDNILTTKKDSLSNAEKYSIIDDLQSDAEKIPESASGLQQNSKILSDIADYVGDSKSLLAPAQQSTLEKSLDAEDYSNNLQAVEENMQVEVCCQSHAEKNSETSENLQQSAYERSNKSIDPQWQDSYSKTTNYLQSNAESNSNIKPLQPNRQENTKITVALQPNTKESSMMEEDLQLTGEVNSKHLNTELNKKASEGLQPELEDIPRVNLDLQVNGTTNSKITESANKIKEHLQLNAEVIPKVPEYPQLKTGELPMTKLQPNTKGSATVREDLKTNGEENSKTMEKLQLNTQVNLKLAEEPQLMAGRNPKIIEDQQPNVDVESNISQDLQVEAEKTPSVELQPSAKEKDLNSAIAADNTEHVKNNSIITLPNVALEKTNPFNSSSHVFEHSRQINTDIPVHTVSQSEELWGGDMLTETDTSAKCLVDESKVYIEEINGATKEFNLQPSTTYDNSNNISRIILVNDHYQDVSVVDVKPVEENYLNILSLDKSQDRTARTISFDNGIECRSLSPTTISDSPSSPADCNDVRCDSPLPLSDANDSGIVSSQAYTPEEHIPFKTFPSEIFSKNISDTFAVDRETNIIDDIESSRENIENTVSSAPKYYNIVNVKRLPILEEKERRAHVNSPSTDDHVSLAANLGSDVSIGNSAPDKLKFNLNSEVYVAKVSVKTVNVEEVQISPYGYVSDVISVGKVESPTFEKELICLPNLSPPPANTANDNTFQVLQCFQEDKNVVTNREDVTVNNINTFNNCEKTQKKCLMEAEELPSSNKENDVAVNIVTMLPNDCVSDSIPQYTCVEKELPTMTCKSTDVLIENLKNKNLTGHTSDDVINGSLQTHTSESELASDSLSSDAQWEIRSCDSLSELNPDSEVTRREPRKLNDVLFHSALQCDVNLTDDISSATTTPNLTLPDIDHSESSNELFQQKANEIIFTVLNSAIDELQNMHKNCINLSGVNNHSLISPDVKIAKEKLSENDLPQSLEDYSVEVQRDPSEKSWDNILNKSKDPLVSIAGEIVNEVIASSKKLMVSDLIQNGLNKNIGTNEVSQHNTPNELIQSFMNSENDADEEETNSSKNVSLSTDNAVHLPSYEINSNVLATMEMCRNDTSTHTTNPYSLNDLGSSARVDMRDSPVKGSIESKVLTKTEDTEEQCNCEAETKNVVNVQTDSYPTFEGEMQGYMENEYHNRDKNEYCNNETECSSLSPATEGSMNELFSYPLSEGGSNMNTSGTSTDFSDLFQFLVHKSRYIEISDDELSDEDKDTGGSGQTSAEDSFLSVQSRRIKMYPFALSPIYEDDNSCEDVMSSSSSPGYSEEASDSGNNHTSILSLLQSVSDRLKEADIEETSHEERFSSLNNEATIVNDQYNKDTSETLDDILFPSKTNLYVPAIPEEEKTSGGKRSGLFITKSITENRPNPVSGRQSFLLHLTSQSNKFGGKPSAETISIPVSGREASLSPTNESSSNLNTNLSPNTASVNALSPLHMATEPALSIQKSDVEYKPRLSSKSVYYQYFNATQNYSTSPENKENPAQEKLEGESKETEETQMHAADSDSLKFNPRPGKVVLSDILDLDNKIELQGDVVDATSWVFPNGVNIRVIRGCWILYEKPHFEGQAHVLEEGEAVLHHLWDLSGAKAKPDKINIGSVKRVVKDYLPEVVISSLQETSDSPVYIRTEVPSLENLVDKRPRSLTVNSGVWLAYTEPQYNGTVTVLEEGCELPQIQDCGVKSMRPLKMGGLKVQLPSDPKIIIYEKPYFQGWLREITEHVCSIETLVSDGDNTDIGSVRVLGGIWVGYEKERYKGQQYLLEEGDYEDWHAWGGYCSTLQSIRYLQANLLEASVTLFDSEAEDGKQLDLFNQAIPDLEMSGYNTKTQCIHVKMGMWVAYQQKHFCGEQYILEKGRYKTYMDWGGSKNTIMSIRPVLLEPLGRNEVKHLIKAYKSNDFQGDTVDFTQDVCDFTSFVPRSFKVLRGCWLLCYEADTCDHLCVLEEGLFPDLASCGCPAAEIRYIKPIDYVFAEPSVSLFALDSCEGRELHFEEAVTSVLSKDLHFYAQSVWIRRGLWIAFEGANFLGNQMLLEPQQILNWSQFSGWKAIGSLRPLKQPAVYFMVKNRHKDKYLTVTGKMTDTRATFVSVSARNGQSTQIWYFCRGLLRSKANDSCLDVIGGRNVPGSKVSLWTEHGKTRQKWKINKDGTIASYISDDLVLDLKGGNYYDQNYIVVNRVQESSLTQKWDIEIL